MIRGLDVSKDQGDINWYDVAAWTDPTTGQKLEFAFIKATDGITTQDPQYKANLAGAQTHGLTAYPYHFFRPLDDGLAQAQNFLQTVGSCSKMMLDLEYVGGTLGPEQWASIPAADRVKKVQAFLAQMQKAGIKVVIYTVRCFIEELFPNCLWLADYPLAISHPAQPGRLPAPWTDWYYWQDPAAGHITGIQGAVDLDYLNDGLSE